MLNELCLLPFQKAAVWRYVELQSTLTIEYY